MTSPGASGGIVLPRENRMTIEDATPADVEAAAEALTAAFARDALVAYFFRTHPAGVGPASTRFFSLLLRLRLALGMPA